MLGVLGIEVDDALRRRWVDWLAPPVQPFFVASTREWPSLSAGQLCAEQRDTLAMWRVDPSLDVVWLDEQTFLSMSRRDRTRLLRLQVAQGRGGVPTVRRWADLVHVQGQRFVWWPSLLRDNGDAVLERVCARSPSGAAPAFPPSRHAEVRTWDPLPHAQAVAGSFAPGSGPNCFTTVLAAVGVDAEFDEWLGEACAPGGEDDASGTVLVWRTKAGDAFHAAITIGDGWVLEKPSREWWTPRAVHAIKDVIRANRTAGLRLERHHIRSMSSR